MKPWLIIGGAVAVTGFVLWRATKAHAAEPGSPPELQRTYSKLPVLGVDFTEPVSSPAVTGGRTVITASAR